MREGHPGHREELSKQEEKSKQTKTRGLVDRLKYALKIGAIVGGTMLGAGLTRNSEAVAGPEPDKKVQKEHNWTEAQEMLIKQMWHRTNDRVMELDSTYFQAKGDNLPTEVVDLFQKKGNEYAVTVVEGNGTMEDFEKDLQGLYDIFHKNLIGGDSTAAEAASAESAKDQEEAKKKQAADDALLASAQKRVDSIRTERMPAAIELVNTLASEVLPSGMKFSGDWMQANRGKVFRNGEKLVTVVSSESPDMQVAIDKTEGTAQFAFARLLNVDPNDVVVSEMESESGVYKINGMYQSFKVFETDVTRYVK
ncbi:MAG: hypothetical protein WC544_03760 [Patescibacteria group bacterium]